MATVGIKGLKGRQPQIATQSYIFSSIKAETWETVAGGEAAGRLSVHTAVIGSGDAGETSRTRVTTN